MLATLIGAAYPTVCFLAFIGMVLAAVFWERKP